MKSVHEPIRECICCGEKFPKANLVRIVKNETGVFVDVTGKQNGRGAYLCKSPDCREKLVKQRRLNKAFRQPVEEAVYAELVKTLAALSTDK